MAIYHLHAKVLGRSGGRSATAAAAYRAGVCITDERTGVVYDFSRRKHVVWRAIAAPDEASEWVCDREKLWNVVEQTERRRDAQVAREVEVSLPVELTHDERLMLIAEFVNAEFVSRGMVADIAVHDNSGNPHAHILLSLRQLLPEGFGAKVRAWNDKGMLATWRESWAKFCNIALERVGVGVRIDHRTLIAQGCRRAAERHEGIRRARLARKLQGRKKQGTQRRQELEVGTNDAKTSQNEGNEHEIVNEFPSHASHSSGVVAFDIGEHDYLKRIKNRLRAAAPERSEVDQNINKNSDTVRFKSSRHKTPSQ